ncbi:Nonribosomal peptide synthase apmB like protein [Verticillium longisporum]|uniref:Nonribosomal peptide synthase apmB like protein n=1 Tax=Verticillium longisporum TaxID=100787 RepID=A0A8I2ZZK9_VERLO|nr:Nonribosomal peptide synthase apmB like protein [Verticillium longisporum]
MFDSTEASVARLRLPRLDTSVVNTPVQEQLQREEPVPELLVEDRLLSAVSNVLDISRHSIDLIDSFTDLGGNEASAQELRKRCMSVGLGLKTSDILRCQTLAELQTCATPFAPPEPLEPNEEDSASDASEVYSDVMRKSSDEKLHSHPQIHASREMDDRHALERLIMSTPEVSGAAVVRPKAGFLEGKLIAFMHFAGSQIAAIRLALEQTASDITLPSNWITWVQNMNESMYKQRTVQKAVARVLRIPEREIGMNFSFPQLGGDEVSTMLLVAACRTQGVSLRPEDIMQSATLSQMASLASYKAAVGNHWSEESLEGFKLSPMQQLYFDTATGGRNEMRTRTDGSYRFNQSLLLRVTSNVTLEDIHAAMETGSYGFGYHHVNDYGDVFMIIEKVQTQINTENGPVFAVEHFRTPDEGTLFSERSMPFQTWNELQEDEITRTGEASPLPFDPVSCDFAYWGLEESLNTYGEAHEISFSISAELTSILHTTCNQVFRTDSADIYMTALHLSFCQTFPDRPSPTIWNKEHGREPWNTDIDITETVGWLTSLCPIGLRSTNSEDFLHVLRDLKDTRRSLARRGWDYFASRYFGAYAPTRCAEGWPFEIMFSYNGSLRQLERENGALEQVPIPGPSVGTSVSNFGHEVDFVYNRLSGHQERIGDWIQTFEHLLYEAVGRLRYRAQELTLADVPLLNTDYAGLAKLNTDRLVALGLSSARDIEDVYPVTAAQQQILISQTLSLETCHSTNLYELTLLNGTQADQSHIYGLFDQVVLRQCSPNMLFFDAAPGDDPISALKNLPDLPTNPAQPRHRLSVCNSNKGTYIKLEASQALCDMFSMQLLVADLRRIYNSGKTPMKVQDPSRSACVQYLETARRDDSLLFWQNRLKEMPPCHFPRLRAAAETTVQETHHHIDISSVQLDDFCRNYAVSRATILRLGWALALRAFTGSSRSIEAIVRDAEEDFASCLAHEHIGASEVEHALGLKGETLFNTCFTYMEEPPVLKSRFSSTRPQMGLKCVQSFDSSEHDISIVALFVDGNLACSVSDRILSSQQSWSVIMSFFQAVKAIINSPLVSIGGLDLSMEKNNALLGSERVELFEPAGGCIVPVDGEDSGMVEAVIKQVNPQVILVTELIGSKLHLFNDSVIVVNEALFSTHLQADSPTRKASGDDVACILFPAGSSRTKELHGFAYSHTALSSAFLAQGSALAIDQESRVLQISSFSIDTALVETLATLIHGGCICIPSPTERKRDVDGAIRRMAVTWTYLTPILARRLNPVKLPSLKVTCFRTRGLDEDTCGPWMEHTKLLLVYGCLEICPLGISAFEASKREDLQRVAKPFLGKFWIAKPEDASKLVPDGAIGELCIESPIIAQKFVYGQPLKPLTQKLEQAEDGRQMVRYVKTSQRVRYMEDGSIELLPSSCQDMAVDGKVVESAKVEQELRRCLGQGVDVAVEAVVCKDGTQLLAAFVQLEKSWDGSEELTHLSVATRERVFSAKKVADPSLRDMFPTHMVPRVYIPIKRLPVTTAMKINRRKLQKMVKDLTEEQLAAISGTSPAHLDSSARMKPLPLTQVEERMRSIWADLLDVSEDAIDGNQSFIKLGGGTYLAAKLVVASNRAGMSINITDILRGASLTELCQSVTLSSEAMLNVDLLPSRRSLNSSSGTLLNETFIEEIIVPQLGVERKAIKDVCEAFPAQVRSLELGMMKDRGDVTYITLNIARLQSVKKLESACFGLCMIHPILRSVFVAHERKVYQVAVRSSGPDFKKLQCPSWRLSGLTAKLIKKDQEEPLTLGKPITRFIHVDSGHQSTLIMRLSKAQCDEASIPILIQDLKRLYTAAEKPPRRPTHFEFIRFAQTSNRESAMKHWASLLENAEMTRVVPRDAPAPLSTSAKTIREKVSITSLSGLGITLDTVVKAAWAIVLANLSASGDVLFGEIVDGGQLRLADGSSVSGVVGPTGNTIPVRVRFGDAYCTPMDILQTIHGQRALVTSFENMDWRAVVENSPKIPLWTPFSTAVFHQPTEDKKQPTDFKLGNASCKLVVQESPFRDLHDLLVTSSLPSPTRAEIALTFCENRIPRTFADETLKYLVSTIELLTSMSMMHPLIPSATDFATMRPQLPLPQPDFDAIQTQSSAGLPTDLHFAIQSVVATAWTKILDPHSLGVPEKQLHNAAFYDLWGSLIPASQLAEYLTRELPRIGIAGLDDVQISMEEIIANPTMMAQFELVARKIRDSRDGVKKRLAATHRSPAAIGKSLRRLTSNVIKEKGRGRSASDSSTESLALKITHPHLNPPSQLGARPQPIPETTSAAAADPVAEMDGDEIELDEEQLFEHCKNRPAPQPLSLIMERDDSGSSMESLTTGTSESDEEEDIAMPMSRGPQSLGGTANTVSPLTPGVKQGHLFGRSNSGLTEAKGSNGPGLMRKKASSMFGRMGLMGPVGVNH